MVQKLQRIGRRGGNFVQDALCLRRIALVEEGLRERNLVVDRLQVGDRAERTRRTCLALVLRGRSAGSRRLQGEIVTELDAETPCEKFPVPARSAPKPLVSARASVPVRPPHASTRQTKLSPGTPFTPSAARFGKAVEVEVVARSRVREMKPLLSSRSKWSTEIEPSGAVQASGEAEDAGLPKAGLVITGGAGTSTSKTVVDGERRRGRRRATELVAELDRQVVEIRNDSLTSFVNPMIESTVTPEVPGTTGAKSRAAVTVVPSDAGITTSRPTTPQPAGGRAVAERVIVGAAVTGTVTEMGAAAVTGTLPDAVIPCGADAIIATSEPGFTASGGPFQVKRISAPVTTPAATNPDAFVNAQSSGTPVRPEVERDCKVVEWVPVPGCTASPGTNRTGSRRVSCW